MNMCVQNLWVSKASEAEVKQARGKAKPKPAAAKTKAAPKAIAGPSVPDSPPKGTPNPAPTKRIKGKQAEPQAEPEGGSEQAQDPQVKMIADLLEASWGYMCMSTPVDVSLYR